MPLKTVVEEHKTNMKKAVEYLTSELKGVRTGRASTGLVEHLTVEYYGSPTPLNQMATIAAPSADSIMIKPFDPSSIKDIEKAIKTSDLSMAPNVEGSMIRLNVPPLSTERREQIVSQIKQMGEKAKIAVRNIRRDANKQLDDEEKSKVITEDDKKLGKEQIDDLTKKYTNEIDEAIKKKSEEIMED